MKQGESTGKAPPMQAAEPIAARIEAPALAPGLYLVATPIGAARDITLRALDVLNGASVLAAEDTRRLRQLLALHGIALRGRRLLAHHDHNEAASGPALVAAIADGASIAYASDAGTPLVSDPGYRLAALVREAGLPVHALPGPSAVLAALMVAGLPSDAFVFAGFPPATATARRKWLARWDGIEATVILFESPRRVKETLKDLCENHPERRIVICRELTKRFEERLAGTARELLDLVPDEGLKGEVVMLLDRVAGAAVTNEGLEAALAARLAAGDSLRDAADALAKATGTPRRTVYQMGLRLAQDGKD